MNNSALMNDDEAMAIIGKASLRNGSVDDVVVERGAALMESGRKFSVEAFAMFAMHLDPDSRHAPTYHKYAHEHFTSADWATIAHSARIGTPMRQMANDATLRDEASAARSGRTHVQWRQFAATFGLDANSEPSDRLKEAIDRLALMTA